MRQHVLLHVAMRGEGTVASLALVRPFTRVAAVVDVQCAAARERLVTYVAGCARGLVHVRRCAEAMLRPSVAFQVAATRVTR